MSNTLLPPSFLFRFSATCRHSASLWTPQGAQLGDEHLLPSLSELDDAPQRVSLRCGWNDKGLGFSAQIQGKKQAPWCRENRIEDSDALWIWIDTRNTHNIHRASRFCHQFVFLPTGGGLRQLDPVGEILAINRARENPKPVPRGALQVMYHKKRDGYQLDCYIPALALTGFEPAEHPQIGFHWALTDREIGEHTFCCPPGLPYREDPSVWGTLELAR